MIVVQLSQVVPGTKNSVNNSLTSYKDGNRIHLYNYLSGGQRLSKTVGCEMVDGKTVGGKTTTYIYNAGMLLAEDNPDYRINFYYDSNGIATEIGYIEKAGGKFGKEAFYFFTRNGQGDIVGIYRSADSTLVGSYEYDLWGNPVSVIENTSKKVNGKIVTISDE